MKIEPLALALVLLSFKENHAFLPLNLRSSSSSSATTPLTFDKTATSLMAKKKDTRVPGIIWNDKFDERTGEYLPTFTGTHLPPIMIGLEPYDCFDRDTPLEDFDFEEFSMTKEEREENLRVIRKIKNEDIPDLKMRDDYQGEYDAERDWYERESADPWFILNTRLFHLYYDADPDKQDEYEKTKEMIDKIGGPPSDDIKMYKGKDFADRKCIYRIPIDLDAAESIIKLERDAVHTEMQQLAVRRRKIMSKRKKTKPVKKDLAMVRREMMKEEQEKRARNYAAAMRLHLKTEQERKKKEKIALEILKKYGVDPDDWYASGNPVLRKAIIERSQVGDPTDNKIKKKQRNKNAAKVDAKGNPRSGDEDMAMAEIDESTVVADTSTTETNNVRVVVTSQYDAAKSNPAMRKHRFDYTVRITNLSETDNIKLVSRKFEIQSIGASNKDVVAGEGVTGRQPLLKPGESFEYSSSAPLNVRPLGTAIVAARMKGAYLFVKVEDENDEVEGKERLSAELGTFHFIFPPDQCVKQIGSMNKVDEDDDDDDDDDEVEVPQARAAESAAPPQERTSSTSPSMPGDRDMAEGMLTCEINDESETVTENIRVQVTSQYKPERSDEKIDRHTFAYNIRITNENKEKSVQLISRRFEIQTILSDNKDVVQGPGVTGRQPILKPGESFEYTSTAPLSVKPVDSTPVVARMQGEYSFVTLGGEDGTSPLSSTPLRAVLGMFHFVLPSLGAV